MTTLNATFTVEISSAPEMLPGTGRFDFAKQWSGDLVGTSTGIMLSAGDPVAGQADYVALEVFTGKLADRAGSFVLQQSGTMADGEATLHYEIVPGSGTAELQGTQGSATPDVGPDGTHHLKLDHEFMTTNTQRQEATR